ncbi:MAG TPA: hypothetical protein VEF76_02965 [Patescibacteria group bacterium]|nr:hypothetical protein [Patescibacteria group bacterium]
MPIDNMQRPTSYIEWGSILAGTVLALALSLVLLQFGAAVGVADLDDMRTNVPSREAMIGGGIYVLVSTLIAFTLGGYVAGRMRAPVAGSPIHEREVRDGIHGLMVWATGTVLMAVGAFLAAWLTRYGMTQAEAEVAKDVAKEVVQQRHKIAVILAFAAGATSLVTAVSAFAAATKGGDHRDNMVDHSRQISFRRK